LGQISKHSDKPSSKIEQAQSKTISCTKKYLDSNDVVLDYGCGTGSITTAIADTVTTIYALDTSSGMINASIKSANKLNINNIIFSQSTLNNEKYIKASFDVILAFNIIPYLKNEQDVMLRINELLKPGGLFISSTACLAGRKFILRTLLYLLTKVGLVPKMNSIHYSS